MKEFLDQAWCDHDKKTVELIEKLPTAVQLIETEEDVEALSRLVFHTFCEHQEIPERGTSLLEGIRHSAHAKSEKIQRTNLRMQAGLRYMTNFEEDISSFSISERTHIFAQTAASLASRKDFNQATTYINKAISASLNLDKGDPAFRILAMTTNNIAASLEEALALDEKTSTLMLDCAHYARKFWEMAGTWMEVERAEYRLASVLLKLQKKHEALKHAQNCLEICKKNQAQDQELFFANEMLARVYKELNDEFEFKQYISAMEIHLQKCETNDQTWMRPYLERLNQ